MKAASRSTTRRQGSLCARASELAFALFLLTLLSVAVARAARLGGPCFVDDAEIGRVGSCEFQQWTSFAHNGDHCPASALMGPKRLNWERRISGSS
jgi:hypothetical protein